ncbi:hypothetical protein [Curtobacterium sp. HSID17257]|uniref:hypothetical protein n=1 Tax=Curtobacterium sp. HSID17257 TaxID=2419510 RepID=UPI000F8679A0|nr:hypothetical protein [Curtobacterium sp. HSID17257]
MSQVTELDDVVADMHHLQSLAASSEEPRDVRDAVYAVIVRINNFIPRVRESTAHSQVIDMVVNALKEAVEKLVEVSDQAPGTKLWDDLFIKALDRVDTASSYLGGRFVE